MKKDSLAATAHTALYGAMKWDASFTCNMLHQAILMPGSSKDTVDEVSAHAIGRGREHF